MERVAVNPWTWSLEMGFNQAELVTAATKTLHISGQTSVDRDGAAQHAGDMEAQVGLALDNLETVLTAAQFSLGDVVRMNIYPTDVDLFFESMHVLGERLGAAGVMPPGTLLGVARLAMPELMVELEATAQR